MPCCRCLWLVLFAAALSAAATVHEVSEDCEVPEECEADDGTQLMQRRPSGGARGRRHKGFLFLHAYPNQYIAQRLRRGQKITIDGNLNKSVWEEVPFTSSPFVDIAQPLFPDYVLPAQYATHVKVRWDDDYLYVGAFVGESWVQRGSVRGSNPNLVSTLPIGNSNVPYYDNDFEVFIDVSGTNHWYKEFEMNFNNATYDVLWRVPDGGLGSTGVPCCSITDSSCVRYCQNSSWPPFGGTWSMWPNMQTATARAKGWAISGWTAEIAFPLHPKDGVGGLLSKGYGKSLAERYDPNAGAKYWLADFSRAEHPFFTSNASNFPPLCSVIQRDQPTLLGTDQYSCYWEWVWQSVGGHKYMHNPDTFGFLQFAADLSEPLCGNIEWPARYVLAQVYQAEVAYARSTGRYTSSLAALLRGGYCAIGNGCNATALRKVGTVYSRIYNLEITVGNGATSCVRYATNTTSANYTGGPCFRATVDVRMPAWTGVRARVKGSIRESRRLDVRAVGRAGRRECLPLG